MNTPKVTKVYYPGYYQKRFYKQYEIYQKAKFISGAKWLFDINGGR